jgi:hypothetical protein
MANKKYTAEQLRIAREIVDQEEAIEAERSRRGSMRRKASVKRARKTVRELAPASPVFSPRDKLMLTRILLGVGAWFVANGLLGLYAMSSPGGLYYHYWWAIPLGWTLWWVFTWATPLGNEKPSAYGNVLNWITIGLLAVFVIAGALSFNAINCSYCY